VKTSKKAKPLGKSAVAKKAAAPLAKAKVLMVKAAVKTAAKAKTTPVKAKTAPAKAKAVPTKAKTAPAKAKAVPTKAKAVPAKAKAAPAKAKAAPAKAKAAPAKAKAVPAKSKVLMAKAADKTAAKPKATPSKAKPTSKPALPVKAAVAKTAAVTSAAAKATGKVSPNQSSAVTQAVPAAQTPKAKNMSVTKVETVTPPVESKPANTPAAPEQFVRAARPSARLAQITVPSLPPAVASTAAKSSFLPSAAPAVVPVPFAPVKKDPKLANNWKTKKVDELSDAEILAMSDDEYMNDKQMAYYRLKLTRLKQDILTSAGQTTEHLREDTVVVPDPADRATIEEEHALELRTRDRERKLLKKIEQSIQRIDAGDYGFCDETGEAIGVGRLLARPTATLSLEAQQRRELKQKMFGD
jgi:DnaK suppressor protein